jgi:hypothetical protein
VPPQIVQAVHPFPPVTVSVVLPVVPPRAAAMLLLPALTPVASPPALIVAIAVFDELQVTWVVMFCAVLSEYVPVAVNCCVAPTWIAEFAGVTAIEVRIGPVPALTVRIVLPVFPLRVAEMVLAPALTPVAPPAALIVATPVFEDDQVTWLVMSFVLPSD